MSFKRLFLFTLVLAAAACLLTSTLVFAQSYTTGDITGTVTDPSGAVLANATVTLKSTEKGFTQSGTTNAQGAYHFTFLSPGKYTVSASASGFKTTTESASVSVGATTPVNIKLEVGTAGTTVEVTGEAPLLQTDSSEISTTMNTLAVQTLPNPGNDLSFIAQVAPGSTMNTQGGYGNFSSFGISATSNLFTLNGMYDNDPFLNLNNSGATNLLLGNNEVQEATVVSNGYSGQYGGFAGATVNYVTKSGSNQWHGNAAYWWNGRTMNANDWFNNDTVPVTPRAFDNANQYAASFGGPIKKDKAFFFANYEGLRVLIPVSNTVLYPSPAFQAATLANLPNFYGGSDLAAETAFYNNMFSLWNGAKGVSRATAVPFSSGNNGGCGGQTFTGGLGTTVSCANTFVSNAGQLTHEYLLAGRFDFNLTNNDKFFIRAQEDKGIQATYTDPINSLFNTTSNQPEYQSQAQWTHSFGTKAVNNLVASTTYYSAIFLNSNRAATLAAFPGTLDMVDGTFSNSEEGTALGGIDFIFPQGRNVTQYQFVDDFSYSLGSKHTLKVGENFHKYDIGDHDSGFYVANLTLPLNLATGSAISSFFDGGADGVINIAGFPAKSAFPVRIYGLGWYVQDEWRATPTLKLTFDLRMDHPSNPYSGVDPFSRFSTTFQGLDHSASIPYNQSLVSGLSTPIQSLTTVAWQPRFGFAWTPPGLKKTVLRGGIGMFADTFPGVVTDNNGFNPPFANYFTVAGFAMAPTAAGNPYTVAANANTAFVSGFSSGQTLAQVGVTPNVNSANVIKVPIYEEWNFQIEQQIGNATSFTVNYVGNHGYHETVPDNGVNAYCPPSLCPTGFAGLPSTPIDPRWLTVNETYSGAVSNYNGVVFSVQHRFQHGLQLQGNFTWSHALDEISNGGELPFNNTTAGSLLNPLNPYNLRQNYGNADYDTRKYASISYVYQVPYKWGPKPLTDGWQFSGTVFTRSGLPYTVTDASSSSSLSDYGYGGTLWAGYNGAAQPSCGPGAASAVAGGEKSPCLTEADYSPVINLVTGNSNAPILSFSNQRKNQFYGPVYFNTDFTVMKFFGIPHWEQGKLGLGAQFFNFFNHPNFDDPIRNVANVAQFGQIVKDLSTPTSILGSFLGANADPRLIQLTAKFNF